MSKRLPTEKIRATRRALRRSILATLGKTEDSFYVGGFQIGSKPFLSFKASEIPFCWSYVSRRSPKGQKKRRNPLWR
jgi:hypothetical protein